MLFSEIQDLPSWVKTVVTLLLGAGGAKLLAVWLENRRLEKREYRDTLLARIRELETIIASMQANFTTLSIQLALVRDENSELRERLGKKSEGDVQQPISRREDGGSDAQPPRSV